MRYLLALVLGLALPLAAASAAELEPDAIAATAGGGLYALDESGVVASTILPEGSGYETTLPAWSPDGSRFAFVDAARRALVVGTIGGGVRDAARPAAGDEWMRHVAWVSRSEVVVYRRAAAEAAHSLWIVSVDDGRGRLLIDAVDPNAVPLPQPGGSLLVYVTAEFRRGVVDVRSGNRTLLPEGIGAVAWSPDGRLLAAATPQGIEVMRPDGGERRSVVSFPPVGGMAAVRGLDWSRDGTRLAFAHTREFPALASRFGIPMRHEIHSVRVAGGPPQQLTGVIGDDVFAGGSNGTVDPAWWPNGSRLFVRRAGQDRILTMNADGSCETPWPGPTGPSHPLWRPGAAVTAGPLECSSVIVRAHSSAAEVSHRGTLRVRIVLFNDGTQPLRDVRLVLRATRGTIDVPGRGCGRGSTVVCAIGELPVARGTAVSAGVTFGNTGGTSITASASYARGTDVDPSDDTAAVSAVVSPCDVVGTWSADRLIGSARGDLICGRPGGDFIDARAGNDTILAGSGGDTVVAGAGRDRVDGGGGVDTVRVRDGQRDVVDCGSERDVVVADRADVVRRCEQVRRR